LKKLPKNATIVQTIVRSISVSRNILGYGGKFYENENSNKTKGKTDDLTAPHSNARDFHYGGRFVSS
jgi:hypothetical protein